MLKVLVLLFLSTSIAYAGDLPDPKLTPGEVLTSDSRLICVRGYSSGVRNVTTATKNAIFKEYKIKNVPGAYEVDHLISLELGGSNDPKNLWIQSYTGTWNAHIKDALENKLHALVCSGEVPLAEAQHQIAVDWISAYKTYISPK